MTAGTIGTWGTTHRQTCRTILVPLDGLPLAERALPFARILAAYHGSTLLLVRVVEASTHLPDHAGAQLHQAAEAREYLTHIGASLGVPVQERVCHGRAADAIVDKARQQGADLVVMSSHGRSGLGRLFMGSVADEVLRSSPVPVLLIPTTCERDWNAGGGLPTIRRNVETLATASALSVAG